METTNGFSFLARIVSRQMTSEATADPPGLSTRSTIAATDRSSLALRMARESVRLPIVPYALSPPTIAPEA